ncbi:hypothetical protein EV401DRAFT_1893973 [Pisolithus croceorrhizus]|nr:hypothetical protein EV401DRAFT_1893973 [Pisolithus croceorrhizus]
MGGLSIWVLVGTCLCLLCSLENVQVPESANPQLQYIMPTSPKSQSPAADPALSALVDIALTSVLWGYPLTPSSVIQRSELQKPRSQLTNLQRCLEEEVLAPASFSSMELQLSALVIACAILNSLEDVTEWDIDRFAELKRNVGDKTKCFPYPQWGLISDPATILDVHGRVVVWYLPSIMSPARVEHLNKIHLPLKDSLVKCSKTGGQSKRRFGHKHVPEGDGNEMFGYGCLMNSPAIFQQHFGRLIDPQRLRDKVYKSSSLTKAPVRQWLQDISYAEEFWNTIAEIVLPDLAQVGKDAISVKEDWVVTQPPSPISWPSIYLGIDITVNQETPPHLDQVSALSLLDLPGTMIYLAGKVLTHSIPKWGKGERIALAHYMKDAVHNRFGLPRPPFTQQKHLLGNFYRLSVDNWLSPLALADVKQSFQVKISCENPLGEVLSTLSSPPTETRRGKPAHKEVDARHLYLPSGSQPSTPRTPRTMGSSQNLDFSDFSNSLDIPNSDWNDVEGPPQSRRHTKSQNDFIREWLPWRAEYLNVILEGEQLAKGGICHGGDPCPQNWSDADPDRAGYMTGEEPPNHRQRLFPASISKPKTAFTFDVLDHFLVHALECKTSAMSFYQKLKRFTNNAFPERDRYRELMRISQLWRDLKHRKWFGLGHDMEQYPGDGELALFCPACPQPGVNLPADWKVQYDRLVTYIGRKADYSRHMKMNKPELDVALSDGRGFMVAEVPYQSHLKQSLDSKKIFRKGRGCQWSVNFRSRVKNSPSLLPPALEIVPVVGKFHLAAHKLSCFPRYSLNFIKGAGHLDGEILETLWAPFNKISPTARSMTQAHRKEVYDDHMRDSNWKKLVGMVPSLLKKYKNSSRCLEEMNQAYEQLTTVLDPDKVAQWELDALRAEADRGEALDIYLLKGDKALTFHEVWLQLTKKPKSPPLEMLVWWHGSQKELALRTHSEVPVELKTCRDQLRSEIQQLSNPMSTRQEVKISEKRQRLSSRIEKFHSNGQTFCKGLEIDGTFTPQEDPAFCGTDEEEHKDREFWDDDDEGDWEAPEEVEGLASELMSIWMPSSIGAAKLTELGLHDLLKEERELRIGQANDCLDQLRTDLGNKAMLYQQNFRATNSTREGTRTKKEIQKVVARVNKHVRSYHRARQAILRLDPDANMAERYQEILPEDLLGTSKLAWFWVMDGGKGQLHVEAGGLMEECNLQNQLAQSKGKKGQMERRSVTSDA